MLMDEMGASDEGELGRHAGAAKAGGRGWKYMGSLELLVRAPRKLEDSQISNQPMTQLFTLRQRRSFPKSLIHCTRVSVLANGPSAARMDIMEFYECMSLHNQAQKPAERQVMMMMMMVITAIET